jgi:peroxiredoxin (alkyl hydroperoxide reductase subunit C)
MKAKTIIFTLILGLSLQLTAQDIENYRIPFLGEKAPSFTATSTQGEIDFPQDFYGKWKIIFSHPADFTPVCTSEILALAALQDELKKMNTDIIVISTDGINSHIEWIKSIESIDYNGMGLQKIDFPLVSDANLEVSRKYGMVEAHSGRTSNIRGVFIVDPDNKIQSINFYPVNIGRNLDEMIRTLQALQVSEKHDVLTPVNWTMGDRVLIPAPETIEEAEKLKLKNDPDLEMITWYMWLKKIKV